MSSHSITSDDFSIFLSFHLIFKCIKLIFSPFHLDSFLVIGDRVALRVAREFDDDDSNARYFWSFPESLQQ